MRTATSAPDFTGFSIVVDTREKDPWSFGAGVAVARRTLCAGDYSLDGLEQQVAIERKSRDDLVRTLIFDRDRFAAELAKLASYRFRAVVVESAFEPIMLGQFTSKAAPAAVIAAAASVSVDWQVPVMFLESRAAAAAWSLALLRRAWCARKREGANGPGG